MAMMSHCVIPVNLTVVRHTASDGRVTRQTHGDTWLWDFILTCFVKLQVPVCRSLNPPARQHVFLFLKSLVLHFYYRDPTVDKNVL